MDSTPSRGLLVLDLGLNHLATELRRRNIRVVTTDEEFQQNRKLRSDLCSYRLLVTDRPELYKTEMVEDEYGVISVKDITTMTPEMMAEAISRAISEFKLWKKHSFILHLDGRSKHCLQQVGQ